MAENSQYVLLTHVFKHELQIRLGQEYQAVPKLRNCMMATPEQQVDAGHSEQEHDAPVALSLHQQGDSYRSMQRLQSIAVQAKADQTLLDLEALLADIRSSSITNTPRRRPNHPEDNHPDETEEMAAGPDAERGGESHDTTAEGTSAGDKAQLLQAMDAKGGIIKPQAQSRFMQVGRWPVNRWWRASHAGGAGGL